MNKLSFLCLLMVLIPNLLWSQIRMDSSIDKIKSEFPESKYNGKIEKWGYGGLSYTISLPQREIVFYFNKEKNCVCQIIYPHGEETWNLYIDILNNTYRRISSTQWTDLKYDVEIKYPTKESEDQRTYIL